MRQNLSEPVKKKKFKKSLNVLFPKFMEVIHVADINMSHMAAAGQDGG